MIQWSTNKPSGAIIVAKLVVSFCDEANGYEVLFYNERLHCYYDNGGEEIPFAAIEKWAVIEE